MKSIACQPIPRERNIERERKGGGISSTQSPTIPTHGRRRRPTHPKPPHNPSDLPPPAPPFFSARTASHDPTARHLQPVRQLYARTRPSPFVAIRKGEGGETEHSRDSCHRHWCSQRRHRQLDHRLSVTVEAAAKPSRLPGAPLPRPRSFGAAGPTLFSLLCHLSSKNLVWHLSQNFLVTPLSMGMEMEASNGGTSGTADGSGSLETRPGILLIGSPNVGKRTLLSRLLSIEIPETHDLSSGVLCQGWTIETKYYSADTSVWTANLSEDFSLGSLPNGVNLTALVMVFDMTDDLSFSTLRNWVSSIDIKKFEILLCIGNKADLVSGHQAHAEYRRHMQRRSESTNDPHTEYSNFGINEEEGSSLLWDEEPSTEIRKSYLDWCTDNSIEYVEACASNADFDKCLSVNGDVQGVERLFGALSAHMWHGMILKSGNRIPAPFLLEKEGSTDDESDYELEYETLSHGSDEAWYDVREVGAQGTEEGVEYSDFIGASCCGTSTSQVKTEAGSTEDLEVPSQNGHAFIDEMSQIDTSSTEIIHNNIDDDDDENFGLDDMERLMSEIGNMRDNLRLMPDFQRREMAAKLAMRMATMFGASSDEEEV